MAKIVLRPLDKIADKWSEVTPARAPFYEAGVKEPKYDWSANAIAAAPV